MNIQDRSEMRKRFLPTGPGAEVSIPSIRYLYRNVPGSYFYHPGPWQRISPLYAEPGRKWSDVFDNLENPGIFNL